MQKADNRPRVYSGMPARAAGVIEPIYSHCLLPTRGGSQPMPGHTHSSLLAHGFNCHWATALNFARMEACDYFLLHHDDIEIRTHGWLDLMIEEMKRVDAAVLSAVQPLKDESGLTSTAIAGATPWLTRKLAFDEIAKLPPTFNGEDAVRILGIQMPAGAPPARQALLVNTGLLLVDVRRPEFHELVDGETYFKFEINDRIVPDAEGTLKAEYRSEDWNFSRLCHSRGLHVCATSKVQCLHWGAHAWANFPEEGK